MNTSRSRLHRYGAGQSAYFGVHGWGGGHQSFAPLVPHMPAEASLYAVDLPGYGDAQSLDDWRVEAVADHLVAAIDSIDAPRLTLVGNCSGALYGLMAARRRPERFERLVLIDPFGYFPWYFSMLTWPLLGRFFYTMSFANPVGRWLTNAGLRSKRTEASHLTESFTALDHAVVWHYLRMLREIEAPSWFSGLTMPVDIAYGEKTFGAIRRSLPIWREVWPHVQTHELSGAAHLPIQEATRDFARLVFGSTTAGSRRTSTADGSRRPTNSRSTAQHGREPEV